jgi:hypothetical protein
MLICTLILLNCLKIPITAVDKYAHKFVSAGTHTAKFVKSRTSADVLYFSNPRLKPNTGYQ